ncbi:glycosyl transferase family 1 [Xylanimonas oleitrophica]|uniref:Glycosyl transferase family 1 n=1 Tax=Xylanimonas oleitrophica TaxID=2607479 RepID=A0A2W5WSC1_9MICO|nr:glycosyl transferase family 1 [Xylanimonas oleitrophica]
MTTAPGRTARPGAAAGPGPTARPRHLQVYRDLRTAHLERALSLPPADLLYLRTRYDFDPTLAARVPHARVGLAGAVAHVLRHGYASVEVNEPAALESARLAGLVVVAVRLRDALTGRRTAVVTYAIGNVDPRTVPAPHGWWPRLGRRLDLALARWAWRRCDRVVLGTDAAGELYPAAFGPPGRRAHTRTVLALPSPCTCPGGRAKAERSLLFVGDLSPRKGFDHVLAAWPVVRERHDDARLVVVGRGELTGRAAALAAADDRVTFLPDPARDVVHRELDRACVLVLPSQRHGAWREQVGLPVVEGLAHGCTVVTTDETGLAAWLSAHGHRVVPAARTASDLPGALVGALAVPLRPGVVLGALPAHDARLAAGRWLRDGGTPGGAGEPPRRRVQPG